MNDENPRAAVPSEPTTPADCAFCEIVARRADATIIRSWDDAIAIQPLNPVTYGHTLVIPRQLLQGSPIRAYNTGDSIIDYATGVVEITEPGATVTLVYPPCPECYSMGGYEADHDDGCPLAGGDWPFFTKTSRWSGGSEYTNTED